MATDFQLSRPAHQFRLGLTDPVPPPKSLSERYRPATLSAMVGQGPAVFRLEAFLEAPYSTAFLFEGPTGVGKTTAALAIAAELGAVEFGGLETIKSGMQDADAVEQVLANLRFTPMLGSGWKVVIVDEADYMSVKAGQVWLSALEDLPARSVIVFTTNRSNRFQDRFLDRCERITFEGDAEMHRRDAVALIAEVWSNEIGRIDPPALADLPGVVDDSGQLSYRRIIRALEPLLAAARHTPRPVAASVASPVSPDLAQKRRNAALKAAATRRARLSLTTTTTGA